MISTIGISSNESSWTTSTASPYDYNFDCSSFGWFSNASLKADVDRALAWERVLASRAAAAVLCRLYRERLKPLLMVFRRFEFRSAPRWRALRWKSKT